MSRWSNTNDDTQQSPQQPANKPAERRVLPVNDFTVVTNDKTNIVCDPSSVLLLVFDKYTTRPIVTFADLFDMRTQRGVCLGMLFSLMIETVSRLLMTSREKTGVEPCSPLSLRLECVQSKRTDGKAKRTRDLRSSSCGTEQQTEPEEENEREADEDDDHERPVNPMTLDAETINNLMLESCKQLGLCDDSTSVDVQRAKRFFLKDLGTNMVVQYRFWIYITTTGIDFNETLYAILRENDLRMASEKKRPIMVSQRTNARPQQLELWQQIGMQKWLEIVDTYLGHQVFTQPLDMPRNIDEISKLTPNTMKPLNVLRIFSPIEFLKMNMENVDKRQKGIDRYALSSVKEIQVTDYGDYAAASAADDASQSAIPHGPGGYDSSMSDAEDDDTTEDAHYHDDATGSSSQPCPVDDEDDYARLSSRAHNNAEPDDNRSTKTKSYKWFCHMPCNVLLLNPIQFSQLFNTYTPDYIKLTNSSTNFLHRKIYENNERYSGDATPVEGVSLVRYTNNLYAAQTLKRKKHAGELTDESLLEFYNNLSSKMFDMKLTRIISKPQPGSGGAAGASASSQHLDVGHGASTYATAATTSQITSIVNRSRDITQMENDMEEAFELRHGEFFPGMTDLVKLSNITKSFRVQLGRCDTKERKMHYDRLQAWSNKEFTRLMLDRGSGISEPGKKMLDFLESEDMRNFTSCYDVYDPTLSVFANMIIRRMMAYEHLCILLGSHSQFLIYTMARGDAYVQMRNLGFNIMTVGPSNTTKSFLLELLERCSVEGTTVSPAHKTRMADTGEGERVDLIMLIHEFNPEPFKKGKNRDNVQASVLKDIMTRAGGEYYVLQLRMENGRRMTEQIKVVQRIVIYGASNEETIDIDEAFGSRMHWSQCRVFTRPDKSLIDLKGAENSMSPETKRMYEFLKADHKREQCVHWVVEKAIFDGVLAEPTLTISNYMIPYIQKHLGMKVHPRTIERMFMYIRRLVISTAFETMYNVPLDVYNHVMGGTMPNMYMQPFNIKDVYLLDPWLSDRLEHIVFTFGLFADQFIDPLEGEVARMIKIMLDDGVMIDNTKPMYLSLVAPGTRGHQQPFISVGGGTASVAVSRDTGVIGDAGPRRLPTLDQLPVPRTSRRPSATDDRSTPQPPTQAAPTLAQAPMQTRTFKQAHAPDRDTDYTYVCISKNSRRTHELAGKMLRCWKLKGPVPGEQHIREMFSKLSNKTIESHEFKINEDGSLVPDTTTPFTNRPIVKDVDGKLYIHVGFLPEDANEATDGGVADKLETIITKCTSHARTKPARMLFGRIYSSEFPQIFRVIQNNVDPTHAIRMRNVIYMNSVARDILRCNSDDPEAYENNGSGLVPQTHHRPIKRQRLSDKEPEPVTFINIDDDSGSIENRLMILGIEPTPAIITMYHNEGLSRSIRRRTETLGKRRGGNYPKDYIEESLRIRRSTEETMHSAEPVNLDELEKISPHLMYSARGSAVHKRYGKGSSVAVTTTVASKATQKEFGGDVHTTATTRKLGRMPISVAWDERVHDAQRCQ